MLYIINDRYLFPIHFGASRELWSECHMIASLARHVTCQTLSFIQLPASLTTSDLLVTFAMFNEPMSRPSGEAEALAFLRRESLDIYNRLHSIEEDITFVNLVKNAYPDMAFIRESST
jgi:hypothetical protein